MAEAFLGVERSLMGRLWLARNYNKRLALTIAQRLAVSEVVGRVLDSRGITIENSTNFLNPTLKDQLPDPAALEGLQEEGLLSDE